MSAAALKEAVTGKTPEQPVTRELTEYERFRNYVQTSAFINDIAILVGGEAQARTFVRVVLTAIQANPRLLEADRRSLLLACMKAARDRLMPDGKEAVLNIYNTKVKDARTGRDVWIESAQYLPMSAGLIKKLYDSGVVKMVDAAAVYANDGFKYERGDTPKLVHEPTMGDDPGIIIAAYVVVTLTNGEVKREVMPRRDIETVRSASKAPDSLMWKTYYDQGAIKSVIKRAYKQLPSSVELEQVIAHDNEAMGFRDSALGGFDAFNDPPPPPAADTGKKDEKEGEKEGEKTGAPAIEHKPGETVPPMPINGDSTREPETVAAGGETKAASKETRAEDKGPTFAAVSEKINAAKSVDELNEAVDLIRSVVDAAHRRQLNLDSADKRKALTKDDGK